MHTNELVATAIKEREERPYQDPARWKEYKSSLAKLPLHISAAIEILKGTRGQTTYAEVNIASWLRYDPRIAEPALVIVEERLLDLGIDPVEFKLRPGNTIEVVGEEEFEYDRRAIWQSTRGLRHHTHETQDPCRYIPWTDEKSDGKSNKKSALHACTCNSLLSEIYLGGGSDKPRQGLVTKLNRQIVAGRGLSRPLRNSAVTSIGIDYKRSMAAPGFQRAGQIGLDLARRFNAPAEQEIVRELARQCAYTEPLHHDDLWLALSSAANIASGATPDSIDWVGPERARAIYDYVSRDAEVERKLIPSIIARCNSQTLPLFFENEEGDTEERDDLLAEKPVASPEAILWPEKEDLWTNLFPRIVREFSTLRTHHPRAEEALLLRRAFVTAAAMGLDEDEDVAQIMAENMWMRASEDPARRALLDDLLKRIQKELVASQGAFGD